MADVDDDDEVRGGYAAREEERQWLAGTEPEDPWRDERKSGRELDEEERMLREQMRREIEEDYNRSRFGIEDDDRVGRVWGGEDDLDTQPTGVIRTAGLTSPEPRYIPGRARMGRDGDL
jgi:hypothetical protein